MTKELHEAFLSGLLTGIIIVPIMHKLMDWALAAAVRAWKRRRKT